MFDPFLWMEFHCLKTTQLQITEPYLEWITSRKQVGTQNEKRPNRDI